MKQKLNKKQIVFCRLALWLIKGNILKMYLKNITVPKLNISKKIHKTISNVYDEEKCTVSQLLILKTARYKVIEYLKKENLDYKELIDDMLISYL